MEAVAGRPAPAEAPRGLYWNGSRLVLISSVPLGRDGMNRPLARAAT
jgi:hypothetical protein